MKVKQIICHERLVNRYPTDWESQICELEALYYGWNSFKESRGGPLTFKGMNSYVVLSRWCPPKPGFPGPGWTRRSLDGRA